VLPWCRMLLQGSPRLQSEEQSYREPRDDDSDSASRRFLAWCDAQCLRPKTPRWCLIAAAMLAVASAIALVTAVVVDLTFPAGVPERDPELVRKELELRGHSYAAPTDGRCLDASGKEVQHVWRTIRPRTECQKECDNRNNCQAYAYHPLRAACNLYGPQLQVDAPAPLWTAGMPISENCPVGGGVSNSTQDPDARWACHVKTEVAYTRLFHGSDGCTPGRDISTLQECEVAIKSLGLPLEIIFNGSSPEMPRYCSIREGGLYRGEHLNWNTAAKGSGRTDLAPVCFKDHDGCMWLSPSERSPPEMVVVP